MSSAYISALKARRLRSTTHSVPYRMPSARRAGGGGGSDQFSTASLQRLQPFHVKAALPRLQSTTGQLPARMPSAGRRRQPASKTPLGALTAADQRRAGIKLDEGCARDVGVARKASVLAGVLSDQHCSHGWVGRQGGTGHGGGAIGGRRGRAGEQLMKAAKQGVCLMNTSCGGALLQLPCPSRHALQACSLEPAQPSPSGVLGTEM